MSDQQTALVELITEAIQARVDEIRLELYRSVDQALRQAVERFFRRDGAAPAWHDGGGPDANRGRGEPVSGQS